MVHGNSFAEQVGQIRWQTRWDPAGGQQELLHMQRMLLAEPSAYWQFRLRLAQLPNHALRSGLVSARQLLGEMYDQLTTDLGSDPVLLTDWHLSYGELLYREGLLVDAYRHTVAALEAMPEEPEAELALRLFTLSAELNCVFRGFELERPAEQRFPVERWLDEATRMGYYQSMACRAMGRGDLLTVDQLLDSAARLIGPQARDGQVAEYWIVRCMEALHLHAEDKFATYLTELKVLQQRTDSPLLRAELAFLEVTGEVFFEARSGISETQWSQLAALFHAAGVPAGLSLRVLRLEREFRDRMQLPGMRQLLSPLRENLGRDDRRVMHAGSLLILADLVQSGGDARRAYAMVRQAMDLRRELRLELQQQHRQWAAALDRRFGASEARRPYEVADYSLLFALVLLVFVLWVSLRYRTQKHLARKLEETLAENRRIEALRQRTESMRRAFLANMSHEIKTPLNGLMGMASLLDQVVDDPVQRKCVHSIQICSENLLVLVNDLLDLGRLNAGDLALDEMCFQLAELIDYWSSVGQPMASNHGLSLAVAMDERCPQHVAADPVRLSQVVLNLISFCCQHAGGGEIHLSVHCEAAAASDCRLRISVAAQELQLESHRVATLFEPFSLPQPQQAEARDNGLGLALSKRLVEIMDGTLESGNLTDGGFRFVFSLPVRIPDGAEVVRLANNREFELLRKFGRIDQIGRSGVLGVEEPPL